MHRLRDYLLTKPEAEESFPFGVDVAVFKIRGKMFATLAEENGLYRSNLKCSPDEALLLRELYSAVTPGYHMNKKHWNTVFLDGSVGEPELQYMVDLSYRLVLKGLKKIDRDYLQLRYSEAELFGQSSHP